MDVLPVAPVPTSRHHNHFWADLPSRVSLSRRSRRSEDSNDQVSTARRRSREDSTTSAEDPTAYLSTPALSPSLSPESEDHSLSSQSASPTSSVESVSATTAAATTSSSPPTDILSSEPRSSKRSRMPFRQKLTRHFGETLSPEQAYLSYYDILLTYEDIKALKNDWLTDNNIAFWEEWLEREILCKYPRAHVILLRPSMTFLLMKEPDLRQVVSALPDFRVATHIFMPINDARNVAQAEGGSHWSLLLVSAVDGVAFHYDSLGGANYQEARDATNKMARVLGRPLRFLNLEDSPQQENGSDCGVFVCILMRHLLVNRLLTTNSEEKVSMSMANKMVDSNGGRKEMLKIIEGLRKEGERRRSRSASPYSKTPPRIE